MKDRRFLLFRTVSLFSGCGGLDLGFIKAGFQIVWANDIDKTACETYRKNIGDHIVCASLHDINLKSIPDCDVVIGGPPCQGFSVAGKMDPNDPRSQLIWDFFNVIQEKSPKVFVMENVANFGTSDRFKHIRSELITKYIKLGYSVDYRILNSKFYQVPQSRERFILIGSLGNKKIDFPIAKEKVITTREAIHDLGEPGLGINQGVCKAKITVAKSPVFRKSPYAGMLFNGMGRPIDLDKPAPTLSASMGGNKTPIIEENILNNPNDKSWIKQHHSLVASGKSFNAYEITPPSYLRRLTVRESARIQTFPDSFEFVGSQCQQYKQIGNAVPVMMAHHVACSIKDLLTPESVSKIKQESQSSFFTV